MLYILDSPIQILKDWRMKLLRPGERQKGSRVEEGKTSAAGWFFLAGSLTDLIRFLVYW
jgi:hypothetical protein